ncbi:MAG: hydrogenase formation protein HypD [Candidatus Omnitrophota bacterium]|jgi:hydrogenase expression/formation protein HypD
MKYIDEFRSKKAVRRISQKLFEIMPNRIIRIMEVCGTHTQSFQRFGLNKLIPESLELIAGPGCPVCVSDQDYVDRAIQLSQQKNTVVLTFGDMLRVPGTHSSLQKQRAEGSDVRIVYSAWDALRIAERNPKKLIVFLAVGFETTAPTLALTLQAAKQKRLSNLVFFSALKLIPPAMKALVSSRELKIDGFLCPGHVSTVIGSQAYAFIPRKYQIACCVAGFEPLDIMEGIYLLLYQIIQNKPQVKNQYVRAVKKNGNPKARAIINEVFKISDANWRGLGVIPSSGLKIKDKFSNFDAEQTISAKFKYKSAVKEQKRCRCGDVLKGIIRPLECPLYARACTPGNPYGPCMVSSEGACNAYYRYK